MENKKDRFKDFFLKKANILTLLGLISIIVLTGGYLYYHTEQSTIQQTKSNELETFTRMKIKLLSDWYNDELNDAKLIAHELHFVDKLEKWYSTKKIDDSIHILSHIRNITALHNYNDVILLSTSGKLLITTNKEIRIPEEMISKYIKLATESTHAVCTDIYYDYENNTASIDFISKVTNENQKVLGFYIFRIDPSTQLYPMINYWPAQGTTAEIYIVTKKRDSLIVLSELRNADNQKLTVKFALKDKNMPPVQAVQGYTGIYEGEDYAGNEVLSYVAEIPDTPWYIVSQMDKSEIKANITKRLWIIAIVVVMLITVFGAGLASVYNRTQRNVYIELYRKDSELRKAQEKYRITLESIGDGVISTDTKGRIDYMNRYAEELTGWKLREAKGRKLHEVYSIKNEETGEQVIDIVDRVIKSGIVKELANHTILISKKGEYIPVMDTGAPLLDENGRTTGIVLVFEDETSKRREQQLLKESEARLRSRLDNMLEGCQIINNEWKYIYVNDAAAEHGRTTKENIIGRTMMECYPGIENTALFEKIKEVMDTGINATLENEFNYPDGTKGWFELSIQAIDEGIFILSQEITRRKEYETKLIESAVNIERLNRVYKILSNVNQLIVRERDEQILFDEACRIAVEDGKFLMAWIGVPGENGNVGVKAKFGRTGSYLDKISINLNDSIENQCITGKSISSSLHYISNDIENDPMMTLWRKEAVLHNFKSCASFPLKTNGKTVGAFSIYSDTKGLFDAAEIRLLDELAMDISFALKTNEQERKKEEAEIKFKDSVRRFNNLVSELPDVVWSATLDENRVIDVNEAFEEIYGLNIEEIRANPQLWIKMVHSEDRSIAKESNDVLFRTGRSAVEYRIVRPDGGIRWISDRKSVIHDENGKAIQIGGIAKDITESKQAEEVLIRAKEKAEEMNRIKTNFFSNMSHELRTPLIGILGFSEILKEQLTMDSEKEEMVDQIHKGGTRLLETLNLVLNIAKIEEEKIEVDFKEKDIIPILQEVTKLYQGAAIKKNIHLTFYASTNNINCRIDENLFRNIFNNLINNAIKFTHKGSITITAQSKADRAVIRVADEGEGIAKGRQAIIWDEFRQASEGFGRRYEGTGLGLTIAKKFTEIMNGKISVISEVGRGSIFIVELPLLHVVQPEEIRTDDEAIQSSRESYKPETNRKKLLYVEDDDISRNFVTIILKNEFEVDLAESGTEGLSKIRDKKYDLILVDINLERGMNGIEFTKQMRQITGCKDIPVIAVTAYAMPGDKEKFVKQGMTDYISKPFLKNEMIDMIKRLT